MNGINLLEKARHCDRFSTSTGLNSDNLTSGQKRLIILRWP